MSPRSPVMRTGTNRVQRYPDDDESARKDRCDSDLIPFVAGHVAMRGKSSPAPSQEGSLLSLHGSHRESLLTAEPPSGSSRLDTLRVLQDVRRHLERCAVDVEQVEQECVSAEYPSHESPVVVSTITIRLLAACLSELLKLERPQSHRDCCPDLCQLLDCPQQPILRRALGHTIEVLQRTRGKFKSKELAELRVSLEALLENSGRFAHLC